MAHAETRAGAQTATGAQTLACPESLAPVEPLACGDAKSPGACGSVVDAAAGASPTPSPALRREPAPPVAGRPTLAEVFRRYGAAYLEKCGDRVPAAQRKVMHAIEHCRDGAFGYAVYRCDGCGARHHVPRSCGNRHCPTCQQHKADQWLGRELGRLLPCEYFLVTFTVRQELRGLVRSHPAVAYGLMFQAATAALSELAADPRHIGAVRLGMLAVLHTWGGALNYHPHLHFVVPAGGLAGDGTWRGSRPGFFLPERALGVLFRNKLRDLLKQAGLGDVIDRAVWKKTWVADVQSAGDGRNALRYLARYVFRVAISNSRIVSCDNGRVTFRYKKSGRVGGSLGGPDSAGGASGSRWGTMTLEADEFIGRFLDHVLPRGFQKVRHYGFWSAASRVSIDEVRRRVEEFTFQLTLTATALAAAPALPRPVSCPRCGSPMRLECLVLASGRRLVPRRLVRRSTLGKRRAGSALDTT